MKKLLIAITFLMSTNASAGILLEPYLGYNAGKTSQSGSPSGDLTGVGYGLRAGWTLPLIFIGVDYAIHDVDWEPDGAAKNSVDIKNLGVVIGATLPVIRVWAGYNFDAEADVKDAVKYEGSGMKAGVGFKMPIIPVSFNLEYIINEYDKANGMTLTNKLEAKTLFVSVSAPLSF